MLAPGKYFVSEDIEAEIRNVHNVTLMGSNTGNTAVNCSKQLFLSATSTDLVIAFIAWLNLDLDIEVCFYSGLNTYAKTWLQLVFSCTCG